MGRAALKELPVDDALNAARDKLAPLATTAKEKGLELLDSDKAHELRRRGHDVYASARGELPNLKKARRWPLAMGFLALGAAAGAAASFLSRRMETPVPWQPTGPAADVTRPPTTSTATTTQPTPAQPKIDLTKTGSTKAATTKPSEEIGATPTV